VSTSVSVRLPDETAKALEELAHTTERSKTSLILKALEAYLADYANTRSPWIGCETRTIR